MFLTSLPDEFVFEQTMLNPKFATLVEGTTTIKFVGVASITSLNEYLSAGGFMFEGRPFVTVHSISNEYWIGLSVIIDDSVDIPTLSQDKDLQWKFNEKGLCVFY